MSSIILIIIILLLFFFWPQIVAWLRQFMARRAENAIRRMFGMPSRKEEERARQKYQERTKHSEAQQKRETAADDIVKAMQQYAEDVDFVEIKEDTDDTKK